MQWSTGDLWLFQSRYAGGRWPCCGQYAGLHCWLIDVEAGPPAPPLLRRFDYRDAPDALGPVGNFLMAALLIFLCGASVFFTVGRQFQVRRYLACNPAAHAPTSCAPWLLQQRLSALSALQADLVPLNDEYAAMMAEAQAQQRQ